MANSNPPIKNQAWSIRIALLDTAQQNSLKANPTLTGGDFQVDIDGAGFNTLTGSSSVAVSPAASVSVLLTLAASDMNGDVITVKGIDQTTPKEWSDFYLCIQTTAGQRYAVGGGG